MFVILHHNFLVLCIFGSYCKKTTRLRQIEERFGLQLLKRKCLYCITIPWCLFLKATEEPCLLGLNYL